MSQSLSSVYLHAVFSTKDRRPFLKDPAVRAECHAYLAGISKKLDCPPLFAGGVEDHIHLLARQSRTVSQADWVTFRNSIGPNSTKRWQIAPSWRGLPILRTEYNGAMKDPDSLTTSPAAVPSPLAAVVRDEIARTGPITFARYMDLALYHPEWGYYHAAQRRPGRPGDFLTAPEAHPFFGITLARQIAECWERLDRPTLFTVREYGPGIGGLAWDIIGGLQRENPACLTALSYELVERNPQRMA